MRNHWLLLFIAFLVSLPFRGADAQQSAASPSPTPGGAVTSSPELVITGQPLPSYQAEEATAATRLPERILDTDRSVQVVTGQLIEDQNIIDPQEAVQDVSGVQRGGSRTGVGEVFFIRGFQQGSLFKDGFRVGNRRAAMSLPSKARPTSRTSPGSTS
jgi:outer membrane receptor protein involved in Fe transport